MAKKVEAQIKLVITGGAANPSPPVGPALGQHGLNIQDFCKQFNAATQAMSGIPTPVIIDVYSDRSFTFETGTPPAAYLLLQAAGLKSGSGEPNKNKVGRVTVADLEEIVKTKEKNLTAASLAAGVRTIAGTARSMGIEVDGLEAVGGDK